MAETQPATSKKRIINLGSQRVSFLVTEKKKPAIIVEIGGKDDVGIVGAQPNPVDVEAAVLVKLQAMAGFKALVDKGTLQVR